MSVKLSLLFLACCTLIWVPEIALGLLISLVKRAGLSPVVLFSAVSFGNIGRMIYLTA